ncbi:hypothetical protein F0562_027476 [Nyssa sinensis]|uniref:Uncharacterized protein n=1 Tax=Nyssa sinensis TaxID=561372 RepID=A0A5J5B5W9_9ASTE|nr:hypothetical protein F0562_027476 [Nyssa sinensis]
MKLIRWTTSPGAYHEIHYDDFLLIFLIAKGEPSFPAQGSIATLVWDQAMRRRTCGLSLLRVLSASFLVCRPHHLLGIPLPFHNKQKLKRWPQVLLLKKQIIGMGGVRNEQAINFGHKGPS